MNIQDYIKPELLTLIPVLYLIASGIKHSNICDKYIPPIIGSIGMILSTIWIIATSDYPLNILFSIYTGITQGILCAGTTVYINQLIVQSRRDD